MEKNINLKLNEEDYNDLKAIADKEDTSMVQAVLRLAYRELYGKDLLTVSEYAEKVGKTPITIYNWIKEGKLEVAREGPIRIEWDLTAN